MGRQATSALSRPGQRAAGVRDAGLAPVDALFTAGQQRVLGLLFGHPRNSYSISEIIAATGSGNGAAQREIARLVDSALVSVEAIGNQKRYQANPYTPIYAELVALVRKAAAIGARAARPGAKKTSERP